MIYSLYEIYLNFIFWVGVRVGVRVGVSINKIKLIKKKIKINNSLFVLFTLYV